MVVLGLRTVKVMALSFSLVDSMRDSDACEFDYQNYWRRSLTTAVAAWLLADNTNPPLRDEAFVGGLLSDIGMLAALHCTPEEYAPVVKGYQSTQTPPQILEQQILGITHAQLSQILLNAWGLPEPLCLAVTGHHGEKVDPEPKDPSLTLILQSAAAIADLFCQSTPGQNMAQAVMNVRDWTQIPEGDLDKLLQILDKKVTETASLFSLDIGKMRNYLDIQMDAAAQLGRLSAAAEEESHLAKEQAQSVMGRIEQIAQKSNTDMLTLISNRAGFDEHIGRAFHDAFTRAQPLGLILMDIDHLKQFNDAYGHQTGDAVLREIGRCLTKVSSLGAFPARFSGEEFAILKLNATSDAVRDLAEQIREAVQNIRVQAGDKAVGVTASLGAAVAKVSRNSKAEDLIQQADASLYVAKSSGRNCVVLM